MSKILDSRQNIDLKRSNTGTIGNVFVQSATFQEPHLTTSNYHPKCEELCSTSTAQNGKIELYPRNTVNSASEKYRIVSVSRRNPEILLKSRRVDTVQSQQGLDVTHQALQSELVPVRTVSHDVLLFSAILSSVFLLLSTSCYIFLSYIAAHDKKGKESFFFEDSTERTLAEAFHLKLVHPSWSIKTDDWGYFMRAYEEIKNDTNDRYREYDVFLVLLYNPMANGVFFFLSSVLTFLKVACSCARRFPNWVILILQTIGMIGFIISTVYILMRILKFRSCFAESWDQCNCDGMESTYNVSYNLYIGGMCQMSIFGSFHLIILVLMFCKNI